MIITLFYETVHVTDSLQSIPPVFLCHTGCGCSVAISESCHHFILRTFTRLCIFALYLQHFVLLFSMYQ